MCLVNKISLLLFLLARFWLRLRRISQSPVSVGSEGSRMRFPSCCVRSYAGHVGSRGGFPSLFLDQTEKNCLGDRPHPPKSQGLDPTLMRIRKALWGLMFFLWWVYFCFVLIVIWLRADTLILSGKRKGKALDGVPVAASGWITEETERWDQTSAC